MPGTSSVLKGLALAAPVAAVPIAYQGYNMYQKRNELLGRADKLKSETLPQAGLAALLAGSTAGLTTYNVMKRNAEKKGWTEPEKLASFANMSAFLLKRAVSNAAKVGLVAAAPMALAGHAAFNHFTQGAQKQLKEGEDKLNTFEKYGPLLGAALGAAAGSGLTYMAAKEKFKMPEQSQQSNYYGGYNAY